VSAILRGQTSLSAALRKMAEEMDGSFPDGRDKMGTGSVDGASPNR